MENYVLETLKNCYRSSPALVLVMDLQWQVLWANRTHTNLSHLPQQLGIPEDHTEHSVHRFIYDGRNHECRLICNKKDGLRIAEIFPCTEDTDIRLRMDLDAVTASVQAMTSACCALHRELDELELYDQVPLLNTLIGSCYRIYRLAYLQKELDRLQHDERRNDLFCVNAALRSFHRKCHEILRICMEIEGEYSGEELFLSGDMDEFQMALLSAVTLCCADCDAFQVLRIELQPGDGIACLQFTAERTAMELPQQVCRVQDAGTGHYEGERAILSQFCKAHDGSWLLAEQPEKGIKSCSLYFRTHTGSTGSLTLHSPRDMQEGRFYNKYEIMLSCMHYRRMF
ncbi:MAG: hypothetical protein IKK51_08750 [Oscillospiraceae bacterium]|nr:hypothetical protein [Oscillospiraceae bacterium]